jgi:hypothetical protein
MNKNKKVFLRHIADTRDCEQSRLENAVSKGLRRAKSGRPDSGKLLTLAAACVFTLAVCVTVNMKPVRTAAAVYYLNRNSLFQGKKEILSGYIRNIENGINTLAQLHIFGGGK